MITVEFTIGSRVVRAELNADDEWIIPDSPSLEPVLNQRCSIRQFGDVIGAAQAAARLYNGRVISGRR